MQILRPAHLKMLYKNWLKGRFQISKEYARDDFPIVKSGLNVDCCLHGCERKVNYVL